MINIDLDWLLDHFNTIILRDGELIGVIESEVIVTGCRVMKSSSNFRRHEIVLLAGLTADVKLIHDRNEAALISKSEAASLSGHIYVAKYRIDKLRVGRRKAEKDPISFARQCAERKESGSVLATWGEVRSASYASTVYGVAAIFVAED